MLNLQKQEKVIKIIGKNKSYLQNLNFGEFCQYYPVALIDLFALNQVEVFNFPYDLLNNRVELIDILIGIKNLTSRDLYFLFKKCTETL